MKLAEERKVIRDELICEGKRVSLYRRIISVNGKELAKDLVKFGESVAIIPLIDNERIVLLRQWRAAIGDWLIEVPAGRVEPGESNEEAASRELEEEAGYRAGKLIKLGSAFVAPGYSDELIHFFIAADLEFVGASPEEGEIIESIIVPVSEAMELILTQKNIDMKTVAALTLLRIHLTKEGNL